MTQNNVGKCFICNGEIPKKGITRHVKICINKDITGDESSLLLKVDGGILFYMLVMVSPNLTLKKLDVFLRNVWFECCGHMSQFGYKQWGSEISMNKKIGKIISNEQKSIFYQYDFGTTSEAIISYLGNFKTNLKLKDVVVLSQNIMPEIECEICKSKPDILEQDCDEDEYKFLCNSCNKSDDTTFFEISNSPRLGMCSDVPNTDLVIMEKYAFKK